MRRALDLAAVAAEAGEVPVGAVITLGDEIIAEARNSMRGNLDPTAHAEMVAIRHAATRLGRPRLDGCTLWVTLEPCAMCAGALVNARVGRLVYGAADPKAGFCGSLGDLVLDPRLNHRAQVISGVLADRCGAILSDFFAAKRRLGKK